MSSESTVLREALAAKTTRAKALREQNPHGLTAEQKLEVAALIKGAQADQAKLDEELRLEAMTKDLADLDAYMNKPVPKIPHGVNGDDDDHKSLLRAGWEIKNDVIYAPTSLGVMAEMFHKDVLFGEVPTRDHEKAEFYRTTRAAMADGYKSAYANYIRAVATAPGDGMAFQMLSRDEQKALSEGTDTAGGFLVPPDIQAELLVRVAQQAVMRRFATVQPTNRDTLRWPAVAANSSFGSIYSSGFVGSWAGETPAFTDVDAAFRLFDIPVKKLRVATKLSNDFISDASVNVLAFLSTNGAANMALTEDLGFITGDGTALQPLGILNAGITTFDVEGSTANTLVNTTTDPGSAPKIVAGAYQLPSQYTSGARWLMKRTIEGKVRALTDASGRPLWPPMLGSGLAAAPPDLVGFPVVNSDWMPSDGTDANAVLILGDFSNYIIAQRMQTTSVILRERFADTDQTGIILWERVGGGVFNTDAFRVGVV